MITYILILPILLICCFFTLPIYIALTSVVKRIKAGQKIPKIPLYMLYAWYGIFYVVDVIVYNWFFATILLWEAPRKGEWTMTARLTRHVSYSRDFRQRHAIWFCLTFLSPFDEGHCGEI